MVSKGNASVLTEITAPHVPSLPTNTPPGSSPQISKSEKRGTSLFRMEAAYSFACSIESITQLCLTAHASTEKRPFTSVAVVITASPPVYPAMRRARSFAPPMWPESSEITCFPCSSRTITAGSLVLLTISGAIARTAMPHAPMKISASASWNSFSVSDASPPFGGFCAVQPSFSASIPPSCAPLSVKYTMAAQLISPPPGIRW